MNTILVIGGVFLAFVLWCVGVAIYRDCTLHRRRRLFGIRRMQIRRIRERDFERINRRHETKDGLDCVHVRYGLCPKCRREYWVDPSAWLEFGDNPIGLANCKAQDEAMERDAQQREQECLQHAETNGVADPDIPF